MTSLIVIIYHLKDLNMENDINFGTFHLTFSIKLSPNQLSSAA